MVGLLPGSRRKEIVALLPDFLAAAERLAQSLPGKCVFLVPRAPTVSPQLLLDNGIAAYRDRLDIRVDNTIGSEAARLLAASQQAPLEAVVTSLIHDLDTASGETVLVLDDYQFISSQAVHEAVAFLLEHCPRTCHLVIASR